ncbi:MAG: hypothetical protein LBR72_03675 [Oscillospiraceae bacterium]|nr:hypothetical protein [Oscillospiraceae bacterium]
MRNSPNSSAVPVILEGRDESALRREALLLASEWIGERRKVLAGLHVDVSVLESEPGAVIKVEAIRAIRKDSLLRPFDGGAKVYIIARAHQMNGSAQNALLRLLEEPPEPVRFVLTVENAGLLLPTVRSRCVVRRLTEPAADKDPDPSVSAFIDAGPWERAAIALSWERSSRDAMKELLHSILVCLRDRCEAGGASPDYIRAIGAVSGLLPALEQNASVGSICGVLAAM